MFGDFLWKMTRGGRRPDRMKVVNPYPDGCCPASLAGFEVFVDEMLLLIKLRRKLDGKYTWKEAGQFGSKEWTLSLQRKAK